MPNGTRNRLEQLAAELAQHQPAPKRAKHNRTLSLDQANFLELQTYCRARGLRVSDVMDRLVAEFLETLNEAGELPAKDQPQLSKGPVKLKDAG
jgi:hypothetical protein